MVWVTKNCLRFMGDKNKSGIKYDKSRTWFIEHFVNYIEVGSPSYEVIIGSAGIN